MNSVKNQFAWQELVDTVTKLEQDLAHKHKAELGKRKIGPQTYFSFQA